MQEVKNISFNNVNFDNGFWKLRYDLNRQVSIKSVYERFEASGRFDALRFCYAEGKPYPHIFFDSDVAKWIEAVAYLIQKDKNGYSEEQKIIDELVEDMAKNQLESGYLNSHFIQIEPQNIFTDRSCHELYCAGHLIEAAIAYDKATAKRKMLEVMLRYVDYIEKAFIFKKTAKFTTGGHEEIELALLKLYEHTGTKKYLDLALWFINNRGNNKEGPLSNVFNKKYDQSEIPVRTLEEAEGHAVRAVYLYVAMSEAALKTKDKELQTACERLFDNIINKRMYVTGGIGSSANGETFTVPYDLPNLEAYSESCAAIGLLFFALSMQQFGLNAKYPAVIERIMYNNLLSSTSLDGKAFFYENPLEFHLPSIDKETSISPANRTRLPIRERLEVFDCSCCPPNINRIFAKIGDVFFSETSSALIVNQYGAVTLSTEKIDLTMQTEYPVNGKIKLTCNDNRYDKIYLRKPEWCDTYKIRFNGSYREENRYILLENTPEALEAEIDFCMRPYFVEANPNVRADAGKIALCYGSTVYCLESVDNPTPLHAISLSPRQIPRKQKAEDYPLPDFTAQGFMEKEFDGLYRKALREKHSVALRFRPYYTFANRGECNMLVWIDSTN